VRLLRELWLSVAEFLRTFGAMALFFVDLLRYTPSTLFKRFNLVVYQVFNAGALSIVIIIVCGLFVGGVLGLQAFANLERFNAEEATGILAGFALVKEIGPVITALLFAGRAGTALASEIGLMKATDQLSAMEMMAVNPMHRVLVPRFLGGIISMPLLTAVFTMVGLLGAHLVAVELQGVDVGAYWQQLQQTMDLDDVYEGITKSIVFGVVASLLAVWEGYNAIPTAEGVEIEAEQLNDLGVDLGLADNLLQLLRIFAVVLQVIQGMVACPLLAQHPLRLPQVSVDVEAEGNRAVIGALMDERLGALADGGGATVEGERDRIQDARLSAADRADDADEPSLPEVKRCFVAKVGPEVPQPELNRTHRLPPPAPT